jgi:hypothetical protein
VCVLCVCDSVCVIVCVIMCVCVCVLIVVCVCVLVITVCVLGSSFVDFKSMNELVREGWVIPGTTETEAATCPWIVCGSINWLRSLSVPKFPNGILENNLIWNSFNKKFRKNKEEKMYFNLTKGERAKSISNVRESNFLDKGTCWITWDSVLFVSTIDAVHPAIANSLHNKHFDSFTILSFDFFQIHSR